MNKVRAAKAWFSSQLVIALALIGGLAVVAGPLAAETGVSKLQQDLPEGPPRQVIIGLDLSASNPLVKDPAVAQKMAERVRPEIESLPVRSIVRVRTFGVYSSSANHLRIDEEISAQSRPDQLAEGIETLIANIPKLVAEGKLEEQQKTNILPFLETMAQVVDCKAMDTTFILLSDGAEDSEYATLTRSGGTLPAPEERIFRSCKELIILGLGQGFNSPSATKHLRTVWGDWSKQAGFKDFQGLYDW